MQLFPEFSSGLDSGLGLLVRLRLLPKERLLCAIEFAHLKRKIKPKESAESVSSESKS